MNEWARLARITARKKERKKLNEWKKERQKTFKPN